MGSHRGGVAADRNRVPGGGFFTGRDAILRRLGGGVQPPIVRRGVQT